MNGKSQKLRETFWGYPGYLYLQNVGDGVKEVNRRLFLTDFEARLNYTFKNPDLLKMALTHKSYHSVENNERLEFIGDAVLDLSVGSWLMKKYPHLDEGRLSKMRASLVNERTLSGIAIRLGMDQRIRLGRGEIKSGGGRNPRLMAGVYEAVVGAIFWEAGYERASDLIEGFFRERFANLDVEDEYSEDYKTKLQEKIQERFKSVPSYRVVREEGPDHNKVFYVEVYLKDRVLGRGQGTSKKQAEQEAARAGLK